MPGLKKWEYLSVPVILQYTGEFRLTDLASHKQVQTDAGWEYIDMRVLPAKSDGTKAEVVLRFRREKKPV